MLRVRIPRPSRQFRGDESTLSLLVKRFHGGESYGASGVVSSECREAAHRREIPAAKRHQHHERAKRANPNSDETTPDALYA